MNRLTPKQQDKLFSVYYHIQKINFCAPQDEDETIYKNLYDCLVEIDCEQWMRKKKLIIDKDKFEKAIKKLFYK